MQHLGTMLEPIFGLILCVLIYLGISAWSRVSSEFHHDPDFERWCAQRPIVLALRCREPDDARHRLRQLVAPHDQIVNVRGGAPWQYYRFDVAVRALTDEVVAVQIVGAVRQRGGWTARPDARELAERLATMSGPGVTEVWMHGQLHASDARSAVRDLRSWLGHVTDGALALTPMIGKPKWVEALD